MSKENKRPKAVCPDCQELVSPYYDRLYIPLGGRTDSVQAVCPICGWATRYHANVQQCKMEWTNALKELHIRGGWE